MREMDELFYALKNAPADYNRYHAHFVAFGESLKNKFADRVKEFGVTNLEIISPTRFNFTYLNQSYGVRFMAPPLADRIPVEFFWVQRPGAPGVEVTETLGTAYVDRMGNLHDKPEGGQASRAVGVNQGSLEQLMLWLGVAAGVK